MILSVRLTRGPRTGTGEGPKQCPLKSVISEYVHQVFLSRPCSQHFRQESPLRNPVVSVTVAKEPHLVNHAYDFRTLVKYVLLSILKISGIRIP